MTYAGYTAFDTHSRVAALLARAASAAAWIIGVGALSISTLTKGADGRLADQDGRALPNAWVVATREECIGIAHCNSFCKEVKVAQTDSRGNYSFNSGARPLSAYWLTAYQEGYVPAHRHVGLHGLELFMDKGAQDLRFSKLDAVSGRITHLSKTASEMSCFTAPVEQRSALLPVYKAMYREAAGIANSTEHNKELKKICREMFNAQRKRDDPSYPPEALQSQQEEYLDTVEPSCNEPMDESKDQMIRWAIENGHLNVVRRTARRGFNFNRRLTGHDLPIIVAATKNSAEMVIEVARAGAKVDEAGSSFKQETALALMLSPHFGPRNRRLAVIQALLELGANPNRPDSRGYPPLLRVASPNVNDVELFHLLLRHNARIDGVVTCRDCAERGHMVLNVAKDPALVRLAIEHGADVKVRTIQGWTALSFVSSPISARVLLDHGAEVNTANNDGWTPLMVALSHRESSHDEAQKRQYAEIAEMFVLAGARIDSRNKHGFDALHYTKGETLKKRLQAIAAKQR